MKAIIHKADSRGYADHGWLQTRHTFSFADYYNPQRMHFGALRVLNDDTIAAQMGFGLHPHENMEIFTLPLTGAVKHTDSMGHTQTIGVGELQIASAGTGLFHSESNASCTDELTLLQIWILPKLSNIEPRYDQKKFDEEGRTNKLQLVIAPEKSKETLWINQDAWVYLGNFDKNSIVDYKLKSPKNGVYLFNIEGSLSLKEFVLEHRDGIGISDIDAIQFKTNETSKFILMEVPLI